MFQNLSDELIHDSGRTECVARNLSIILQPCEIQVQHVKSSGFANIILTVWAVLKGTCVVTLRKAVCNCTRTAANVTFVKSGSWCQAVGLYGKNQ